MLYVELPDVRAAVSAYARAPLVRTWNDPDLRAALTEMLPAGAQLEFSLADAEAALLANVPNWPFPHTPVRWLESASAFSLSMRTPDRARLAAGSAPALLAERLGLQCVIEFDDATIASGVVQGLAESVRAASDGRDGSEASDQGRGGDGRDGADGVGGADGGDEGHAQSDAVSPNEPIALPLPPEAAFLGLGAWMVADGTRVVVSIGNADFSHAAYVARRESNANDASTARTADSASEIDDLAAFASTLLSVDVVDVVDAAAAASAPATGEARTIVLQGWQRASAVELAIESLPTLSSIDLDEPQLQAALRHAVEHLDLLRSHAPELLAFFTTPPGAGVCRTTLGDDGFVTDWVLREDATRGSGERDAPTDEGADASAEPRARALSHDTAAAADTVADAQLDRVPVDAAAAWICAMDGADLAALLRDALAVAPPLQQVLASLEHGSEIDVEADLLQPLGPPVVYLDKLPGIAPPGIIAEFPIRDAEAYDRALARLLPAVVAALPSELATRSRPYRRQPYHELNLIGPAFEEWPVRPELAFGIADGRLLVGLPTGRGAVFVKERLRQLDGSAKGGSGVAPGETAQGDAPAADVPPDVPPLPARHPLLAKIGPIAGVQSLSFVDWPNIIRDIYGAARALGGLASGFAGGGGGMAGGLPFDLAALPDPDVVVRHLVPHVTVRRRVGEVGALLHVHYTSNFGPELRLALIGAAVAGGMRSESPAMAYRGAIPDPVPLDDVPDDARDSNDQETGADGSAGTSDADSDAPPSDADAAHTATEFALMRVRSGIRVWSIFSGDTMPATLDDLTKPTDALPQGAFQGEPVPRDGWDRPLEYRRDGDTYRLWSRGPDGIDDAGAGDDVSL